MNWQSLWARIQSLGFLVFIGIVACGVGVLMFLPQLQRRHAMQLEMQRLDAEIIRQEQLETQQKQEIEALKTDPAYLERTARDKLNLARPTETIFRFELAPGSVPQSR